MRRLVSLLFLALLLCGCYNRGPITPDAWDLTRQQLDSISFYTTHHYTQNFNFVVTGDSLVVVAQQPEDMAVPDVVSVEIQTESGEYHKDSITLLRNERIVVADIKTGPSDTIDSVWVKVARDQLTFGWVHESELLSKVSPDDPISQFIDQFSNVHLLTLVDGVTQFRQLPDEVLTRGFLRQLMGCSNMQGDPLRTQLEAVVNGA